MFGIDFLGQCHFLFTDAVVEEEQVPFACGSGLGEAPVCPWVEPHLYSAHPAPEVFARAAEAIAQSGKEVGAFAAADGAAAAGP